MVTNYPHPVASDRGVRTATVETQVDGLNVIDRLRQMFCGLHGHDNLLQFEAGADVSAVRVVRASDPGLVAERSTADGDGPRRCAASRGGSAAIHERAANRVSDSQGRDSSSINAPGRRSRRPDFRAARRCDPGAAPGKSPNPFSTESLDQLDERVPAARHVRKIHVSSIE